MTFRTLGELMQVKSCVRPPVGFLFCCLFLALTAAVGLARGKKDDIKKTESEPNSEVQIKNFGRVNDCYYRGGQPEPEEYAELAKLGVKTIIDLRDDPTSYAAERASEAGLRYISFPMSDHKYPEKDAADKFLSIVTNDSNWPVYVHCAGGRHRTGAMTAVYRMTIDGWDVKRAYSEMKDYDFYTRWGHGSIKDYVFDFAKNQADDERVTWYSRGKAMKTSQSLGFDQTPRQ
jgi:protein tyrosine/serine phosphatase